MSLLKVYLANTCKCYNDLPIQEEDKLSHYFHFVLAYWCLRPTLSSVILKKVSSRKGFPMFVILMANCKLEHAHIQMNIKNLADINTDELTIYSQALLFV